MRRIRVASVQIEHAAGDKEANLKKIRHFVDRAAEQNVEIIVFPECCVTGYWFLRNLSREQIDALAEPVFDAPDAFRIDRQGPRHLSFGAGIHFCIGSRLAEMQLQILWEELLERYPVLEVRGEPHRLWSNFINGIKQLNVRVTRP